MEISGTNILGYKVYDNELALLPLDQKMVINTLNGHSYTVAKKDDEFKDALQQSDVLLPDGVSVVMGVKMLSGKKIHKIAGYDLFIFLMNDLEKRRGSCFFLGSSDYTLNLIRERVKTDFPNVQIESYSPPYKPVFTTEDNIVMREKVNHFKPRVLFVGMTAPKQEKWVHANKGDLNTNIICSIGAVFDFYAGSSERPPHWMINFNLEWLGRLFKEPKRMWKRYILSTPGFFIDVFRSKFRFR